MSNVCDVCCIIDNLNLLEFDSLIALINPVNIQSIQSKDLIIYFTFNIFRIY